MYQILILIILIWYSLGILGFIYWWTKDFDYNLEDFLFSLFIGLMGPVSFIAGYHIHRKNYNLRNKQRSK